MCHYRPISIAVPHAGHYMHGTMSGFIEPGTKLFTEGSQENALLQPRLQQGVIGWGAGIRTPTGRVRVCSPTVRRHPSRSSCEGRDHGSGAEGSRVGRGGVGLGMGLGMMGI